MTHCYRQISLFAFHYLLISIAMTATLAEHQHGKSKVRVARVWREGNRHYFVEWSVDVMLESDMAHAFLKGTNTNMTATDTQKNTVRYLLISLRVGKSGIVLGGDLHQVSGQKMCCECSRYAQLLPLPKIPVLAGVLCCQAVLLKVLC